MMPFWSPSIMASAARVPGSLYGGKNPPFSDAVSVEERLGISRYGAQKFSHIGIGIVFTRSMY